MNKAKSIQKGTQRFVLNYYTLGYETLMHKSNKCTIDVRQLQVLPL